MRIVLGMLDSTKNALGVNARPGHTDGPVPPPAARPRRGGRRAGVRRVGTALAAALTLALAATGCTHYDTTAPSAARADADADHKAPLGAVDCRKAKCIALTFDAGPSENTPRLLDILKEKKVPRDVLPARQEPRRGYPETGASGWRRRATRSPTTPGPTGS